MLVLGAHLLLSAVIASAMAWEFGSGPRAISTHVLLIAQWDLALLAVLCALAAIGAQARIRVPRRTYRFLLAVTCTLQVYLYALNIVSNLSWDRNMTAHLVLAFAPTVWAGKEPFPVGPRGISAFACGTLLLVLAAFGLRGRSIDDAVGVWLKNSSRSGQGRVLRIAVMAVVMVGLVTATIRDR